MSPQRCAMVIMLAITAAAGLMVVINPKILVPTGTERS
jgi:hypothetical protein